MGYGVEGIMGFGLGMNNCIFNVNQITALVAYNGKSGNCHLLLSNIR